jgi:hypothetical protein
MFGDDDEARKKTDAEKLLEKEVENQVQGGIGKFQRYLANGGKMPVRLLSTSTDIIENFEEKLDFC